MKTTTIYLTEEEALQEFEAELQRLASEDAEREHQFTSGSWAMAPVYTGSHR